VTAQRNSVNSKSIKDSSIKGQDVRDGSLTGADVDESTLTLAAGPPGERGPEGLPGVARAYAYVNPDGTIDPARSKGIVRDATGRGSEGIYCFDLDPAIDLATVLVIAGSDDAFLENFAGFSYRFDAVWERAGDGCPAGAIEIDTWLTTLDRDDDVGGMTTLRGSRAERENGGFLFFVL
jgi:hypothetical protein